MQKRGDVFKGFRKRYFALYPNYILEYYENEVAYLAPRGVPKGCIDLTTVRRIMLDEEKISKYNEDYHK